MAGKTVPQRIAAALDSPEIQVMIGELEQRTIGRRGYGVRALLGACFAKALYGFPTWSRTARLIREHQGLQDALGYVPSQSACYRFAIKLSRHHRLVEDCIGQVVETLRRERPEYGRDVAGSTRVISRRTRTARSTSTGAAPSARASVILTRAGAMPQRGEHPEGRGYYGYKLSSRSARAPIYPSRGRFTRAGPRTCGLSRVSVPSRLRGVRPETAAMDKGYDHPVESGEYSRSFRNVVGAEPVTGPSRARASGSNSSTAPAQRWSASSED